MELKEYQKTTMEKFEKWFMELNEQQIQLGELSKTLTDEAYEAASNYPKFAWDKITGGIPEYKPRSSSAGYHLPNICLNVPTGGGKTLLGIHAIKNSGLRRGFVLWVVPTKTIFDQTMNAFKNKNHEYRCVLDSISGGRTLIMNSKSRFTKNDYLSSLCIMIITLATANRTNNKDFLLMNKTGSGDPSFFPEFDSKIPSNLPSNVTINKNGSMIYSLENVLKIIRPIIILDESHKAYSDKKIKLEEFLHAIEELNPRLILELSATPALTHSNLLVSISGKELHNEDMIKLPIKLHTYTQSTWKKTLEHAIDCLDELQKKSYKLSQKYVRPICVIRVERTSGNQINTDRIHASHVKNYLIRCGINLNSIKIKTSEIDELENEDLMDEKSQVRYIITKDALKEGWDCPFAYVLVILDPIGANTAITQMLGRVMRQPYTVKLDDDMLNSCYIFCFNQKTTDAIQSVKKSLEKDGMKDLDGNLELHDGKNIENNLKPCDKTPRKRIKKNIFLPTIFHKHGKKMKTLDYEQDILFEISQDNLHINEDIIISNDVLYDQITNITLDNEIENHDQKNILSDDTSIDPMFFVYGITDLIKNPWHAYRIINEVLIKLRSNYDESVITANKNYIKYRISEILQKIINKKSEKIFINKLKNNTIQFKIETNSNKINLKNSITLQLENCDRLTNERGRSLQKNLFEEVYRYEFDTDLERDFAIFLDGKDFIKWWHRVAINQPESDYRISGWLKESIHPDFIAYRDKELFIIETKGEHLSGNMDTTYKNNLMKILEKFYKNSNSVGQLEYKNCKFMMLYDTNWKSEFERYIKECAGNKVGEAK